MATENVKSEPTKTKIDLGLLEEDDEFEEFPADGKNINIFTKIYRKAAL